MADGRTAVFAALRAARPPAVPRPEPAARAVASGDALALFREQLETAGGELLDARDAALDAALARVPGLVEAEHVWSGVQGVAARGVGASGAEARELAALDVAVIQGAFGVAECGAVWHVPEHPLERPAALLAEHLVILLDAREIVARLFDAYARAELSSRGFGWLLCGPSKTADIEQALVLGAHGPRRATIVLR